MTPADVTAEARRWIGVPFAWQGRSRAGVDCIGLPAVVGQALGLVGDLEVPRYRMPLPTGLMLQALRKYTFERPHEQIKTRCGTVRCCDDCRTHLAGTIVAVGAGRFPQHCAIATEDGTLISALDGQGVVETLYSAALLRMTKAVFEFPGVVYP